MRVAIGLVIVLCTGVVSQVLASEPQPPPPPSTASATPTAPTPAAQQSATVPDKVEITREEQDLIAQGYKPEMRHGQKYFCRREADLGSHFERKTCNTAESILAQRASAKEAVRRMQANKPVISN